MKSFLTAGLALAACAAMAGVTENFNNASALTDTAFTGDGAIELKTGSDDDKVLAVDGTVTCANSGTASQWGKTTFLVKAPEDGTDLNDLVSGKEVAGCQIAVATGSAVGDKLKVAVYRGKQGEETKPVWEETSVTVDKGAWFTVVLDFDYSVSKVQVLVGDKSAGWFPLVTTQETTSKIASLEFVGSTKVDDVSIAEVPVPNAIKGLTVDLETLGVTIDQIVANATVGSSGLTVQEKIESGLNPTDDSKFTAKAMGANSITVPCDADNGQVYQVVITDGAGKAVATVAAAPGKIADGKRTLTFEMPATDKKVLKFKVEASAPATTSAEED